jgi:hypothetical protein
MLQYFEQKVAKFCRKNIFLIITSGPGEVRGLPVDDAWQRDGVAGLGLHLLPERTCNGSRVQSIKR